MTRNYSLGGDCDVGDLVEAIREERRRELEKPKGDTYGSSSTCVEPRERYCGFVKPPWVYDKQRRRGNFSP